MALGSQARCPDGFRRGEHADSKTGPSTHGARPIRHTETWHNRRRYYSPGFRRAAPNAAIFDLAATPLIGCATQRRRDGGPGGRCSWLSQRPLISALYGV
jgi:hypothetical protein